MLTKLLASKLEPQNVALEIVNIQYWSSPNRIFSISKSTISETSCNQNGQYLCLNLGFRGRSIDLDRSRCHGKCILMTSMGIGMVEVDLFWKNGPKGSFLNIKNQKKLVKIDRIRHTRQGICGIRIGGWIGVLCGGFRHFCAFLVFWSFFSNLFKKFGEK